jgi:hypothetical protein
MCISSLFIILGAAGIGSAALADRFSFDVLSLLIVVDNEWLIIVGVLRTTSEICETIEGSSEEIVHKDCWFLISLELLGFRKIVE